MKKIQINYDQVIQNQNQLLIQLESLQHEANIMMKTREEIFIKDSHALRIAISIIKDVLNYAKEEKAAN